MGPIHRKLKNELERKLGISPQAEISFWKKESFKKAGISVSVLREDAIHPWIQGNKWHKLKPWLHKALGEKYSGVASMGGPFSNHLLALGYATWKLNIPFQAFIRGEESEWSGNPVILKLKEWNADIQPLSRPEFRNLHQEKFQTPLSLSRTSGILWVPMGGSDPDSVLSVAGWARQIEHRFPEISHFVLPVGSGGTVAGFCSGLTPDKKVIAVSSLKVTLDYLEIEFHKLIRQGHTLKPDWVLNYHFGGFGQSKPDLEAFCRSFFEATRFHIEPVYSGKAFFAVSDLIEKGHFPSGSKLLMVHTGGIFPWNIT